MTAPAQPNSTTMPTMSFQPTWHINGALCTMCYHYNNVIRTPNTLNALLDHLDGNIHTNAIHRMLLQHGNVEAIRAACYTSLTIDQHTYPLPPYDLNYWKYACTTKQKREQHQ